MDGIREDKLPENTSPTSGFKVRALNDEGKSCTVPFSALAAQPQENEVRDFLEGNTIMKKVFVSGSWQETGIAWDI